MTYPFVKAAVDADDLTLQGAYFSIEEGKLLMANAEGDFEEAG